MDTCYHHQRIKILKKASCLYKDWAIVEQPKSSDAKIPGWYEQSVLYTGIPY